MYEAKEKGHRAHGQNKIMHACGPKSTPIAQGLVEDINAKHAYGPRSAPIAQGLVYDINASHAFGLRKLKRTYGFVSTPIAQGLVEIINTKDTKMVMSPKAQGLVSNTHHSKTCMVKHCTHDRMSGGKTTKPQNSGCAVKKTTSSDETNHAVVSLLPKKEDSSQWVSTLAPLTLLKAASKHVAKLNENRMMYNVINATKAAMVTPTIVNFRLQMGGGNVYNMEGLMRVDTSDIRKTIMFLMEGHCTTPICAPFEIFGDEIHWELFANLFSTTSTEPAQISRASGTT